MRIKIKDIAIIRSGAYMKEAMGGSVFYLQVGDFSRVENTFVLSKPILELNAKTESHLLLDGDIVLAAKGMSNFGVVYKEEMGKAVASSSFLVIRIIDCNLVMPDYLCWILNREDTLAFFKANAAGSSIPSISKALIEEYIVDVPPINIQKQVVEVDWLQQQEQQIYQSIVTLRSKLVQKQLIEITK
ncbi:MAG: restriction endonuclease subunit S [Eubacteriales bacterium]|nr:restriction endonuclease subunit S [Eubacteriales bacterium]MDD4476347.1 restriction endonuclease subunit S [Eubacteriales bacterium]